MARGNAAERVGLRRQGVFGRMLDIAEQTRLGVEVGLSLLKRDD